MSFCKFIDVFSRQISTKLVANYQTYIYTFFNAITDQYRITCILRQSNKIILIILVLYIYIGKYGIKFIIK